MSKSRFREASSESWRENIDALSDDIERIINPFSGELPEAGFGPLDLGAALLELSIRWIKNGEFDPETLTEYKHLLEEMQIELQKEQGRVEDYEAHIV